MRSLSSITAVRETPFLVLLCMFLLIGSASGQRLAIITPDNTPQDAAYADELVAHIPPSVKVIDRGQADAAFRSVALVTPFNMTTGEAKNVAAVIGCDSFLVIRASVVRRTPSSGASFYEAYAVHYLVDGRTGELITWRIAAFENESEQKSHTALIASVAEISTEVSRKLKNVASINSDSSGIESVPDEGTPAAKNLKTPVPYKRIKPEYTRTAYMYDIKATVDIEVDVAVDGAILGTKILRWAGYGLDESVEKTVRTMNWRPAIRDGKPLPMRVLLRYNFTKLEKE